MMKTEGLNVLEAWQALYAGEIVKHANGYPHKLVGNTLLYLNAAGDWVDTESFSSKFCSHYSIVKPEPKRLSFDEALKAYFDKKEIVIQTPGKEWFWHMQDGNALGRTQCVLMLDVAEKRGWPITVVEE